MKKFTEESYYDVLKVADNATVAEIVNAYHAAKNAFSKDSVATYSLFSAEEIEEELSKLEEAYLTLSNLDKRRNYDKRLEKSKADGEIMHVIEETAMPNPRQMAQKHANEVKARETKPATSPAVTILPAPTAEAAPAAVPADHGPIMKVETLTGADLVDLRSKRGLSQEDVARITKIPMKYLKALEAEDIARFPARVYIQGFIKNMANLYRIEASSAAKAYLAHVNSRLPPL